ncbi:MAG: transketolase C-terminal domain-containing protein, partial [bacterium]
AETIVAAARRTGRIVTLEENALQGGFGSAVLELMAEKGMSNVAVLCIGIGDAYVEQGSRDGIKATLGLDVDSVASRIRSWCKRPKTKKCVTTDELD